MSSTHTRCEDDDVDDDDEDEEEFTVTELQQRGGVIEAAVSGEAVLHPRSPL